MLCTYTFINYDDHYPSIKGFSENPALYEGRIIEMEGRIIEKNNEYYILSTSNIPVRLRYDWSRWTPSESGTVALIGIMHRDFSIEVIDREPERDHMIKYYVSIIGFIIFLFIFLKDWRITLKGFKERHDKKGVKYA